jgi:glutathione synthase/RimK-type ligase-like ATP-grasp enzyme
MSNFLILVDYKNNFQISVEDLHNYTSMNLPRICYLLSQYGHTVETSRFSELDLTKPYKGYYVLYQSAEDIGAFYKDYIEDILFFLEKQGANVLPGFIYLLAHHNKNFMELLRNGFSYEGFKTIKSKLFGTGEEALEQIKEFPVVLKSAEGSGSRGVFLARDRHEFIKYVRELSGVFIVNKFSDVKEFLIFLLSSKFLNKVRTKYRKYTFYRKKFIVQNFIQGLTGDYKVLFFGGKYYTLSRKTRDHDFRASGSGNFSTVPDDEIPGLLDFCQKLTLELESPIIGMDIGFDGSKYHLFEFQCIHIGPFTLHNSQYWHEYVEGNWLKIKGKTSLEEEFCRSIHEYVQK